jgi:hypothetical protein
MLVLKFNYKLDMEWDNFLRGVNSINHIGDSDLVKKMKQAKIDLKNKQEVLLYIQSQTNTAEIKLRIEAIQKKWQSIASDAMSRLNKIFGNTLEEEVSCYLTINQRCGYNYDLKYFFVNAYASNPNGIILHELLHFYTYKFLLHFFIDSKIDKVDFNDFKEALTFLLNKELSDLLDGWHDRGYDRQKELRSRLEKHWDKHHDIYELTSSYIQQIN